MGGRPQPERRADLGPLGPTVRTVLDTSILIANDVPPIDGEVAISAVSLAELHSGLLARSYGQLAAAVRAYGRKPQPRALDLMIAATAHANNVRLVTRNAEDLRGIGDLLEIEAI